MSNLSVNCPQLITKSTDSKRAMIRAADLADESSANKERKQFHVVANIA